VIALLLLLLPTLFHLPKTETGDTHTGIPGEEKWQEAKKGADTGTHKQAEEKGGEARGKEDRQKTKKPASQKVPLLFPFFVSFTYTNHIISSHTRYILSFAFVFAFCALPFHPSY
jgi:hypothetical protein